jgi:hypothetical protein
MTAATTLTFNDRLGNTDNSRVLAFNRLVAPDGQPLLEWRGQIADRAYDFQPVVTATLGKANANGLRKLTMRTVYPVMETVGVGSYDYVAAPKVAYTLENTTVNWIPQRSSTTVDTVSSLNMLQAAVLQVNIVELFESLIQPV